MKRFCWNFSVCGVGMAVLTFGVGLALLLSTFLVYGSALAQDKAPGPVSITNEAGAVQNEAALLEYWTPERMQQAIPMDLGTAPQPGAAEMTLEGSVLEHGNPGYAPGWDPKSGLPQPNPMARIEITPDNPLYNMATGGVLPLTSAPFSPPSSPTDYNNYAPYDRWTWFGSYLTYPTSTIGKLFFTQNGVNYVCSASVIGSRTIATAGHCVAAGDGTNWSSNFLFCPSYYKGSGSGAPYPTRGCWGWSFATTSGTWFNSAGSDRDFACIVTSATNSTTGTKVGNVTGWTGRAWNWTSKQHTFAWGYPSASPFPGYHIIVSASAEWYEVNMTNGDGLVSKYIGSDQTGGCSGGPWWLSMRHPNMSNEYADVDGSGITDPGQGNGTAPLINGVNSHRRCTTTGCPAGSVYLSEQGSPQFTDGADSSEDCFAACYGAE